MVDDKATGLNVTAQRTFIGDKQRLHYEGLFVTKDFYKLIDEYYEEKGYDKREIINAEVVKDNGERFIEIIFEPWKKITDYTKIVIKTRLIMENVKEVEIERNGLKVTANEGKIKMVFEIYMDTDYEGRWQNKGIFALLSILANKYFLKRYIQQNIEEAQEDLKMLIFHIKSYLNMYKK